MASQWIKSPLFTTVEKEVNVYVYVLIYQYSIPTVRMFYHKAMMDR